MIDSLLRAADERRQEPSLFSRPRPTSRPPLEAVIRRCLQPLPEDRYKPPPSSRPTSRAVADDLPLVHAREPLVSRLGRQVRRNRRRLFMAAAVLLAVAALLGAYVNFQFERFDRYKEADKYYQEGFAALERRQFKEAEIWFDNALARAHNSELVAFRSLMHWQSFMGFGGKLRRKLELLWTSPPMDELEGKIQMKAQLSKKIATMREPGREAARPVRESAVPADRHGGRSARCGARAQGAAGPLLRADLQGRLEFARPSLGATGRRATDQASSRGQRAALPLGRGGRDRPRPGGAFAIGDPAGERSADPRQALDVCDRAITFAEPNRPWRALRALLESHRERNRTRGPGQARCRRGESRQAATAGRRADPCRRGELPVRVLPVGTPLLDPGPADPCHRVAATRRVARTGRITGISTILRSSRTSRACSTTPSFTTAWRRGAIPDSAWVRYSRARLYRTKGKWSLALDEFRMAREMLKDQPESLQVGLELGYLHQALGNFAEARAEYDEIIRRGPDTEFARAARLNLANIAAESGMEDRATSNTRRSSARPARRPLDSLQPGALCCGWAWPAGPRPTSTSCSSGGGEPPKRPEILATRAVARLLERRNPGAVEDASAAQELEPSPAHERLFQRRGARGPRLRSAAARST